MRIEIDTQHDTPEDIQKAVQLLQSLSGKKAYTNQPRNVFDNPLPTSQAESQQPQAASFQPPAFGALFESMEKSANEPTSARISRSASSPADEEANIEVY